MPVGDGEVRPVRGWKDPPGSVASTSEVSNVTNPGHTRTAQENQVPLPLWGKWDLLYASLSWRFERTRTNAMTPLQVLSIP